MAKMGVYFCYYLSFEVIPAALFVSERLRRIAPGVSGPANVVPWDSKTGCWR